jgi:hypothetical protein
MNILFMKNKTVFLLYFESFVDNVRQDIYPTK